MKKILIAVKLGGFLTFIYLMEGNSQTDNFLSDGHYTQITTIELERQYCIEPVKAPGIDIQLLQTTRYLTIDKEPKDQNHRLKSYASHSYEVGLGDQCLSENVSGSPKGEELKRPPKSRLPNP